ncbi:MAG: wax ester/triacylglycerol synthase family O-acyltransferase [Burkholderiales bacterium]|nr:wax ester/triacylglycerol synthase family O-acyltransferase [Burkholderiales bacterium]
MSAVDTAWLRMDRPQNLMMICGVLLFDGQLSLPRLRKVIAERFVVFKRFRQRPLDLKGAAFWQADDGFDIRRHVVRVELPPPAGRRELQDLASRLAVTPLDPAHPMWQFHLVDRYEKGSALIARIHHCYADGIALVRVMLSMFDAGPNGPIAMPFEERRTRRERDDDLLAQLLAPLSGVLATARKVGNAIVDKGVDLWTDPAKAMALAGQGTALTAEIAKLVLMPTDSATRLKGMPGIDKRVSWTEPLALFEVKAVGHALGASVNDVLLSSVAGALRGYLADKGDETAGVMLRALVPVNLRSLEKAYKLGNQFGLVFLDLPIGIENPVERLYAVRANMHALKGSFQPVLALGLLAAMGTGPKALQDVLLQALARNATGVMTNVPGPQQPLYLAGALIKSLMFWVPQAGDIGMGVSIISFNGAVNFGVITDAGLCPDPDEISQRFRAEFEKLTLTTLMAPWPRDGDLDPAEAEAAIGSDPIFEITA